MPAFVIELLSYWSKVKSFHAGLNTKYFSISISISASIVVGFSFSTMVDESQIWSRALLNTKYFEVSALDKDVVLVLAQPIQIGNFKSKYLNLSEGQTSKSRPGL